MVEKDNSEERHLKENSNGVNRRRFVKALGTAGAIGFTGIGTVQASSNENEIKREVNEITASAQQKYTTKALSDQEAKKITTRLKQDGWEPDASSAIVNRIDNADADSDLDVSRYHVVAIPFKKSNPSKHNSDSTFLLWTDQSLESVGFTTPMAVKIEESSGNDNITKEAAEDSPIATEYTIEDGNIKVYYTTIGRNEGSKGITTKSHCDCEIDVRECEDIGWLCWIAMAGSFAGTYWACGACAVGAWLACAQCAVVVTSTGAGTVSCFENADCWDATECYTYDEARAHKPSWVRMCELCDNITCYP